jgi:hypothetical protein
MTVTTKEMIDGYMINAYMQSSSASDVCWKYHGGVIANYNNIFDIIEKAFRDGIEAERQRQQKDFVEFK